MSKELYGRVWMDGFSPIVNFEFSDGVLTATVTDSEGTRTVTLFTVEQALSEDSANPIASGAIWDAVHSASLHTHDHYAILEAITSAPLPLSGGTMTGAVILYGGSTVATSPTAGDDSKKVATTEWVQDEIGATKTELEGDLALKADLEDLTDGSVTKLGTNTVGSSNTPVYWNNGVPSAVSGIDGSLIGSKAIKTGMIDDEAITMAKLAQDVQDAINSIQSDVWYVGSTAPTNTKLLWIDPSNGLKYYDGSDWVVVPVAFS